MADSETQDQSVPQEVLAKSDGPAVLPSPLRSALDKVPDKEARAMLQVALSRTTFGFGPDPETAKTLAETEMHEEDCRLAAYKASLANREEQNKRDHDFRKKKLNHSTALTATIVLVTVGGVGGGLYLSATGNTTLGNPVLIASFTLLSSLAGKFLGARDKD